MGRGKHITHEEKKKKIYLILANYNLDEEQRKKLQEKGYTITSDIDQEIGWVSLKSIENPNICPYPLKNPRRERKVYLDDNDPYIERAEVYIKNGGVVNDVYYRLRRDINTMSKINKLLLFHEYVKTKKGSLVQQLGRKVESEILRLDYMSSPYAMSVKREERNKHESQVRSSCDYLVRILSDRSKNNEYGVDTIMANMFLYHMDVVRKDYLESKKYEEYLSKSKVAEKAFKRYSKDMDAHQAEVMSQMYAFLEPEEFKLWEAKYKRKCGKNEDKA